MKTKALRYITVLFTVLLALFLFTACQQDEPIEKVRVTFIADGKTVEVKEVLLNEGVLAPQVPEKEGYTGIWDITVFDRIDSDMTVNAIYTKKEFTITFKWSDLEGNVSYEIRKVKYGEALSALPTVPLREGHTGAWNRTNFLSVTSNIEVEAVYRKNSYTVTFDTNGGTAINPASLEYDTTITVVPVKSGYKFLGWFTDAGCTQAFSSLKVPASDITLYADWEIVTYAVIFNTQISTEDMRLEKAYGAIIEAQRPIARIGYTANGWYYDAEYKKLVTFPFSITNEIIDENNEIHLYLEWIEDNSKNASDLSYFEFDSVTQTLRAASGKVMPADLILPSAVNGVAVTSIATDAFKDFTLGTVTVPSGIRTIGDYAFANTGLAEIIFEGGSRLEKIGDAAFVGTSLTKIVLPDTVKYIGNMAFNNLSDFAEINIVERLEYIGGRAFEGTEWYSSYVEALGNPNIIYIGKNLYKVSASLAGEVVINSGVLSISPEAFMDCSSVTSVRLALTLKYIGGEYTVSGKTIFGAFYNCENLLTVSIGTTSSLISIGEGAYKNCRMLHSAVTVSNTLLSKLFNTENAVGYYQAGESGSYYIPSSLRVLSVVPVDSKIVDYAFYGVSSVENINLYGAYSEIGAYSFYGCSSLLVFTVPEGVKAIGEYAFFGCEGITNISFNGNGILETISRYAFSGVSAATFNFSSSLSSLIELGEYAFHNCARLAEFIAPKIKTVGENAFRGCTVLHTASLPFDITNAAAVLGDTTQIRSVILVIAGGSGPYEIKENVFMNIKTLSSVTIPEGITAIGADAFKNTGLISLSFPMSLVTIGSGAFADCEYLATVNISPLSNLSAISEYMFANAERLISIFIPASVKSLNKNAFDGCISLDTITVDAENTEYYSDIGVLYKDRVLVLYPYDRYNSAYTVLDGTLYTEAHAFTNADTPLNSLSFPSSYMFSMNDAFAFDFMASVKAYGDIGLEMIFPDGITLGSIQILGEKTVSGYLGNIAASAVEFGDSMSVIEASAFENVKTITSVTLTQSLEQIMDRAFAGCEALESIVLFGALSNLTKFGQDVFLDTAWLNNAEDGLIVFDNVLISAKNYVEKTLIIPEGVRIIADEAFYEANIDAVSFNASLEIIGENAFFKNNIEKLIFNSGLHTIGLGAFAENATTEISLPKSLVSIGAFAFTDAQITEIYIPEGVSSIGECAFFGNVLLERIVFEKIDATNLDFGRNIFDNTLWYSRQDAGLVCLTDEEGLEYIYKYKPSEEPIINTLSLVFGADIKGVLPYAFENLLNLGSVRFNASLEFIGDYAFAGCKNLISIAMHADCVLKSIGEGAFYSCIAIETFVIPDFLDDINFSAFDDCIGLVAFSIKDGGNESFKFKNGILYNSDFTEIIYVPFGISGEVVIEDAITKIPEFSFKNRPYITKITLPSAVASIGDEAFSGTIALAEFVVSDVQSRLAAIGDRAFLNSALQGITLPQVVEIIGDEAFFGIENVRFSGNIPVSFGVNIVDIGAKLLVPRDMLNAYKSTFILYDVVPSTVQVIYYDKGSRYAYFETEYNTSISKVPALPDDVPTGFSVAWSRIISDQELMTEDVTIHAVYSAISYSLSFSGADGYVTLNKNYGDAIGEIADPSSTEKQFVMWSLSNTEIIPFSMKTMPAQDVVLYAIWYEFDFEYADDFQNSYKISAASGNLYEPESISIPATYDGKSVTMIAENGFENSAVKYFYLPSSISAIGTAAFKNSSVISISLASGHSLTEIGDEAFSYAYDLKAVLRIDENALSQLGEKAFYYCTSLASVSLKVNMQDIGSEAFAYCSRLRTVNITANGPQTDSQAAGIFAFSGVIDVTLPQIESLPEGMFEGCGSLEAFDFSSVKKVGSRAFYNSAIKSALLVNIEAIEEDAFKNAEKLERVVLGESASKLAKGAFEGCTNLLSIMLPQSLYETSESVFAFSGLKYLILGGNNAFSNLMNFGLSSDAIVFSHSVLGSTYANPIYSGLNINYYTTIANDFVVDGTEILFYTGAENQVHIPYWLTSSITVGSLNPEMFVSSYGITKVSLDTDVVKGITSGLAFSKIRTLQTIEYPNNADGILYNADKDTIIAYPSAITDREIVISSSIKAIAEYAFVGVENIKMITIESQNVLSISENSFVDLFEDIKFFVPSALYSSYLQSSEWSTLASSIFAAYTVINDFVVASSAEGMYIVKYIGSASYLVLPYSVNGKSIVGISSYAFANSTLKTIEVAGSIVNIDAYAFANSNLTSIVFNGIISKLGEGAFYAAKQLVSVKFNSGVAIERIERQTFAGCESLSSFTLPLNIKYISEYAFTDCYALNSISIPASSKLAEIDAYAFYESRVATLDFSTAIQLKSVGAFAFAESSLQKVVLPESLTAIGAHAFENSKFLSELLFLGRSNLGVIADYAFYGCALTMLNLPEKTSEIGRYAFANNSLQYINIVRGGELVSIGDYAFAGAALLTEISFNTKLSFIGDSSFSGCSSLIRVNFYSANPPQCDSMPFSESVRMYVPAESLRNYKNSSSKIWQKYSSGINSIANISGDYSYIDYGDGVEVFQYLGSAQDVAIPESINGMAVLSIGAYAFNSGINSVLLSATVENLAGMAFYNTAIEQFTITAGIKTIPSNPFANCSKLELIEIDAENNLFEIRDGVLYSVDLKKIIAFPNIFNSDSYSVLPSVEEIGEGAFRGLGQGVGAFSGTVNLPANIVSIGSYAFFGMTASFSFLDVASIRYAGKDIFTESLWYENLQSGAVYIDSVSGNKSAYSYKGDITGEFVLAPNTVSILPDAFVGLTAITEVVLQPSLQYIAEGAFSGCYSITSITTVAQYSLGHLFADAEYDNAYAAYNPIDNKAYHIPTGLTSLTVIPSAFTTQTVDYMAAGINTLRRIAFAGVAVIGNYFAFGENMLINNITFDENLEYIGMFAFANMNFLNSVAMPDSLLAINTGAFEGNTLLSSVSFAADSKLTHIGARAFMDCTALTAIRIPSKVKYIGVRAFKNNSALGSLTFATYETKVSDTLVVQTSDLIEIADEAFMNTTWLNDITLPRELQVIGDRAFYNARSLLSFRVTTINYTAPLRYIGLEAFTNTPFFAADKNNTSAGSGFIIYGNVVYSYRGAPAGELVIPENIVSISPGAFQYNTSIAYITTSRAVREEKIQAGTGLTYYEYILKVNRYPVYDGEGNITGYADETITLFESVYLNTTYIVLNTNLVSIGDYAFYGNAQLKSVLFNDSVKEIGAAAFANTQTLTDVNYTQNLSYVESGAFAGTRWYEQYYNNAPDGLIYIGKSVYDKKGSSYAHNTEVVVASGTEGIASYVFNMQTGIINIKIPSSIKTIGKFSIDANGTAPAINTIYIDKNASSLSYIAGLFTVSKKIILSSAPTKIDVNAKYSIVYDETLSKEVFVSDGIYAFELISLLKEADCVPDIYVPAEYYDMYCLSDGWSLIKENIKVFDGIYDDYVVAKNSSGTYEIVYYAGDEKDVAMPSTLNGIEVTGIREYAFGPGIETLIISENVENIYEYAFAKMVSLKAVTFQTQRIEYISSYAFYMCFALEEIIIPDSVKRIGSYAFSMCEALVRVEMSYVERIDSYAFGSCTALAAISIPETVTYIEEYILSGCIRLLQITIKAETPPYIAGYGLYREPNTGMYIEVPEDSLTLYKTNLQWEKYNMRLQAIA